MTQTYFPFDAGAGANLTEAQWQKMAQYWLNTGVLKGVLNELLVYADSTGMQVKIKSGDAWIKGHFFESDVEELLAISTADITNPRIDRVIVRLDWTANTIQLAVLQGVAAVSPTAPALTQNSSRWEISLAQVYVGTAVSTIATGNITDGRNFVQNANAIQATWTSLVLQSGWVNSDPTLYDTKILKDTLGFVHFNGGRIKNGTTTNGILVAVIPAGSRPLKTVIWQEGNIQWTLDGNTGNLNAFGLATGDNIVGNQIWKAEQ